MKGNGIFLHNDPADRPASVFAGITTLVASADRAPFVLLPFVPRVAESSVTRRGPYPA